MTDDMQTVQRLADLLIEVAKVHGVVVTIELKPQEPLAMGHYKMVADVRPERTQL